MNKIDKGYIKEKVNKENRNTLNSDNQRKQNILKDFECNGVLVRNVPMIYDELSDCTLIKNSVIRKIEEITNNTKESEIDFY